MGTRSIEEVAAVSAGRKWFQVYVWRDRQAMEDFTKTELFDSVENHPALTNITSRDFGVLEGPTKVTRGSI